MCLCICASLSVSLRKVCKSVCLSRCCWVIKRGWEVGNICVLLRFFYFRCLKWESEMFTQLPALESVEIVSFFHQRLCASVLLQPRTLHVCVHGFIPCICTRRTRSTTCESAHVCTLIHVCIHAVSSKCYPPLWCGNVWHLCNPAAGHLIKLWCHLSASLCQPVG